MKKKIFIIETILRKFQEKQEKIEKIQNVFFSKSSIFEESLDNVNFSRKKNIKCQFLSNFSHFSVKNQKIHLKEPDFSIHT